jgi:hypothetical protein
MASAAAAGASAIANARADGRRGNQHPDGERGEERDHVAGTREAGAGDFRTRSRVRASAIPA